MVVIMGMDCDKDGWNSIISDVLGFEPGQSGQ